MDSRRTSRGRGALEQALERGLRVDLEREEAAALRDAGGAHLGGAAGARVPCGKAEGLGEAPRGIDREHEGAPPAARGRQAERRRERRLPDAPGPGEDDQLLAVEPGAEVERWSREGRRRREVLCFPEQARGRSASGGFPRGAAAFSSKVVRNAEKNSRGLPRLTSAVRLAGRRAPGPFEEIFPSPLRTLRLRSPESR